ncbi:MAG TPA: hypothetical protein VGM27_11950 [Acidobacteriaceae bacterium]
MNRASILALVFLFPAINAFAQQSVTPDQSKKMSFTHLSTVGADCPIDMRASHSAGVPVGMNAGPTINGRSLSGQTPPPSLAQRIHLTMTNLVSHDIVSAQVTVHGFSDKWKVIDLKNLSQAPDLAKTLEVVLDVKSKGHASSDLSLSHFTAVSSIDLDSITYADGTTWHAPLPGDCSVTPDPIMLVADTR